MRGWRGFAALRPHLPAIPASVAQAAFRAAGPCARQAFCREAGMLCGTGFPVGLGALYPLPSIDAVVPRSGASRQACHAGGHAGRGTQSRAVREFQRHPPPRLATWPARMRAPPQAAVPPCGAGFLACGRLSSQPGPPSPTALPSTQSSPPVAAPPALPAAGHDQLTGQRGIACTTIENMLKQIARAASSPDCADASKQPEPPALGREQGR